MEIISKFTFNFKNRASYKCLMNFHFIRVRGLCDRVRRRGSGVLKEKEQHIRENFKHDLTGCLNYNGQQWEEFNRQLINKEIRMVDTHVTDQNVYGVVLRHCVDFNLFDIGMNYYQKVVKEKGSALSDQVLSRYLSLCALNRDYLLKNKDEIVSIYQRLIKAPVVEPVIAERCISAITAYKDHWKDSFDLLKIVSSLASPTPATYFYIIQACFDFDEPDLGWDIIKDISKNNDRKPLPCFYLSYINYCKRLKQSGQLQIKHLQDLFEFMEEFHFRLPNVAIVTELEKLIFSLSDQKSQWSMKETYIPKNGVCVSCKRMLEPVKLTSSQFQELCRHFVKKVVVGSNVFLKTTPGEIERFKKFLIEAQPYDIVVDGLNVSYARGGQSLPLLASRLKYVVSHFVRNKKKVVVLGRKHMHYWPQEQMSYVFANAHVFLANNLTQDDPLLLYATLKGGENTYFISRDYMRSHLFAMEDASMKLMFRRWLSSHQYSVVYPVNQAPLIRFPLGYCPTAQKLPLPPPELCWHVPYDLEFTNPGPDRREPLARWLCVTRKPK